MANNAASLLDVLVPSRYPGSYEAAVRQDLQSLLNSRCPPRSMLEGLDELARSVFNFGVRDYTQCEMMSQRDREALAEHIRTVIEMFEPRLRDVVVTTRTPKEAEAANPRDDRIFKTTIYFQISAKLVGHGPNDGLEARFNNRFEWASGTHEIVAL